MILEEIKMDEDNPGLPCPRDLHAEFLEGPSAGQTHIGDEGNRTALRADGGLRLLVAAVQSRKPDRLRRRAPGP